jgi:hypothetical protein
MPELQATATPGSKLTLRPISRLIIWPLGSIPTVGSEGRAGEDVLDIIHKKTGKKAVKMISLFS